MMRSASKNGQQKAYIIKLDISGYFMSLPRQKLYEHVKWGLDQQFKSYKQDPVGYKFYRLCLYLWRETLFDDPVKTSQKRGPHKYWNENILPPRKSLFAQPKGKGIVIGNLTSQLVSNIYLDKLDRFIKYDLKYKYYGRYVDDLVIIVPAEKYKQAKKDIQKIENFLKTELDLELHPKKRYLQPVENGVETLGARIYPRSLYLSDRLQKKFYRSAEEFVNGKKDIETIISYLGITKHLSSKKYLKKLFADFGWEYREWEMAEGRKRKLPSQATQWKPVVAVVLVLGVDHTRIEF